ncbi:MAG: ycjP1, partial [Pseudonocardia sp.]|nr:ycjP1 [Pseudonocardia sp.]
MAITEAVVQTAGQRKPSRRQQRADAERGSGRVLRRSPLASVGLHATLIFASFVAVFPIFWILVTSFKPDDK